MDIRRLEGKDKFEGYLAGVYCFHMRVEDVEAERAKCEADTGEEWGAFDDDGALMGRIINNKYDFYLDGKKVKTGGIGGVATLPEYRNRGVIRAIFRELLQSAYKDGEVISTLYPFKHEFYRKQGYEVLTAWTEYSMRPGLLCKYRFDGEEKRFAWVSRKYRNDLVKNDKATFRKILLSAKQTFKGVDMDLSESFGDWLKRLEGISDV